MNNAANINHEQQNTLKTKLDEVYQKVSRDKATEFLRSAVGPRTTIRELMSVLSYDKVADIKEQLAEVTIGDVVQAKVTVGQPAPRAHDGLRIRTSGADIAREEAEILAVLSGEPRGMGRKALTKRVKARLGDNKSLAHVSYLLRRLTEQGKVHKAGERKATIYTTVLKQ